MSKPYKLKIETEEISEVEQKAQAYNILVGEVE